MKSRLRASIVCVHNNTLLVFKGIDPHSHKAYWFLPGGKIEEGEQPWICAEREALEETGYRIHANRESEILKQYTHWWDNILYDCKTFFYKGILGETWHESKPVVDVDYNKGPAWLPLSAAIESFGYTKEIQEAVIALAN